MSTNFNFANSWVSLDKDVGYFEYESKFTAGERNYTYTLRSFDPYESKWSDYKEEGEVVAVFDKNLLKLKQKGKYEYKFADIAAKKLWDYKQEFNLYYNLTQAVDNYQLFVIITEWANALLSFIEKKTIKADFYPEDWAQIQRDNSLTGSQIDENHSWVCAYRTANANLNWSLNTVECPYHIKLFVYNYQNEGKMVWRFGLIITGLNEKREEILHFFTQLITQNPKYSALIEI